MSIRLGKLIAILAVWFASMTLPGMLLAQDAPAQPATTPAPDKSAEKPPADAQPTQQGNQQPGNQQAACPDQSKGSGASITPCPASSSKTRRHKRVKETTPTPPATAPTPAAPTPADTSTAADAPPKKVVRNGGTGEPEMDLAPGLTQKQASEQGQKTSDLLNATEGNLKKISMRQLDTAQQATVAQIKSYVEQAKAAANDGDLQRAYNLALKANLLSADLAK